MISKKIIKKFGYSLLCSFVLVILLFIRIGEEYSNPSDHERYLKVVPSESRFTFTFGHSTEEFLEKYASSDNLLSKLFVIFKIGTFWQTIIVLTLAIFIIWLLIVTIYKKVKGNAL